MKKILQFLGIIKKPETKKEISYVKSPFTFKKGELRFKNKPSEQQNESLDLMMLLSRQDTSVLDNTTNESYHNSSDDFSGFGNGGSFGGGGVSSSWDDSSSDSSSSYDSSSSCDSSSSSD